MKSKDLALELNKWFNNSNQNEKNFWNANPVAKLLKTELKRWGHWKKKPKGWLDF